MNNALIGYTGFVGSNLLKQAHFDHLFNSSNIRDISGQRYDLLVCAAPSAVKWKANKEPGADLESIENLIDALKTVKSDRVIHISTVDVYKRPTGVNEDTPIDEGELEPYGRHRYHLERFISEHFTGHLIIRLPGLFGEGLKKNFIFDLMNNNCPDLTDCDSCFQFYYLKNLWKDILTASRHFLTLVNFTSEPVRAGDLARDCFGIEFKNRTEKGPVLYDMKSKYDGLFDGGNGYIYSREDIYDQLKDFIGRNRGISRE